MLGLLITIPCEAQQFQINRSDYTDRLQGMWLAECIANWTGIQTEGRRTEPPFYTDADWSLFGLVLDQDPWLADDDTDIEYVYLHLLGSHFLTTLTPEIISAGWRRHINGWIWVSNARARSLFDRGILPPATSLLNVNDLAIQIDAQLTTEVFGALAPGMPAKALQMASMPILTTASGHAAHAAQFHVLLYALASQIDTTLSGRDQALWLVDEARKYIPSTSKVADIIDFVRADYIANPDTGNWELTRDRIYDRYHLNAAANGFRYTGWAESSINLATGLMCLLYGELDFRKTVSIGTLSGWDADCPTATMGGLLGLIYGYRGLVTRFPYLADLSDRYHIYRTRGALPNYLPADNQAEDTFALMAERMLPIIDVAVTEAGGTVTTDTWTLPVVAVTDTLMLNPLYSLMQSSANNRARNHGSMVLVSSSANGSGLEYLADGFEHDFSGREWFGDAAGYISFETDSATVMAEYSEPVEIRMIRLIEGDTGGGFSQVELLVQVDGNWISPTGGWTQSCELDTNQEFQIIDFILDAPVVASGFSLSGPVVGNLDLLEVDAFSAILNTGGNLPPDVSVTAPQNGMVFIAPAQVNLEADASDPDGLINQVVFFEGDVKLGEDLSSPYTMTVSAAPGTHEYSALAIDNDGARMLSDPVWILVSDTCCAGQHTWHSYDVITSTGSLPAIVLDEDNAMYAAIELYESATDGGIEMNQQFSLYQSGQHPEDFNHLEDYWSNTTGYNAYPYAGKSAVGRGSDSGEQGAPNPPGVSDLQLHPPENDHLVIAAFVAPLGGYYLVGDLAVHRVHHEGSTVTYRLFGPDGDQLSTLAASSDRAWTTDTNFYDLGVLAPGERIYFGVDRGDEHYYWDATEIAWTVKLGLAADTPEIPNVPNELTLHDNFPNPFNPTTTIHLGIPRAGEVTLVVYNIRGQVLRYLVNQFLLAGNHTAVWDGRNTDGELLPTGLYIARLSVDNDSRSIKMVLLR
ncbi:ADP-ribosylglycohydrolase family protein [Candidatus Neomarinimicrobiota bacterium]